MGKGKILVIEGTDFSGKTTQHEKLVEELFKRGYDISSASFPDYDEQSSYFVKEYLKGNYGNLASSVNPRNASLFYALDRYDSYKKKDWGKAYKSGGNVLFARYITSNILHQASKLSTTEEKIDFIDWLYNMETEVLGLPKEDKVIFLDVPFDFVQKHKEKRYKETGGLASTGDAKDIHENDKQHLKDAYETAKLVADRLGWVVIECVKDGSMRSIEDIHNEILGIALNLYK